MGRYHAYDRQSALCGCGERSDNSGSLRVVRTIERQENAACGSQYSEASPVGRCTMPNYQKSIVGRYHTYSRQSALCDCGERTVGVS